MRITKDGDKFNFEGVNVEEFRSIYLGLSCAKHTGIRELEDFEDIIIKKEEEGEDATQIRETHDKIERYYMTMVRLLELMDEYE
jgi:hypothetical protein